MRVAGMNIAGAQHAHDMKIGAVLLHMIDRLQKILIFKKTSIVDNLIDARTRLIINPAGADILMPNLGISYLAKKQTNLVSRGV